MPTNLEKWNFLVDYFDNIHGFLYKIKSELSTHEYFSNDFYRVVSFEEQVELFKKMYTSENEQKSIILNHFVKNSTQKCISEYNVIDVFPYKLINSESLIKKEYCVKIDDFEKHMKSLLTTHHNIENFDNIYIICSGSYDAEGDYRSNWDQVVVYEIDESPMSNDDVDYIVETYEKFIDKLYDACKTKTDDEYQKYLKLKEKYEND